MSREIDERIVREVLGLPVYSGEPTGPERHEVHAVNISTGVHMATPTSIGPSYRKFSPSTDPAAAMRVVERMRELGYGADIDNMTGKDVPLWQVRFGRMTGKRWEYEGTHFDKSFSLAVTTAALRAVGGEGGRK